ncbi:MAG: PadR family transcriptional regulator [Bacteroidales bacterium]|nr:PadR family transcriptional regulator [Bacteroidales bacterium]
MGRLFAHGDLHLVVLHLIAERPRHGYELIKSIESAVNGAYSPSPGTIYPALTLLEEQGWVEVGESDGSRKLYTITEAGRAYLDANRSTVEAMLARMAAIGASRAAVPAPVIRAMENLKLALRMRLERGPLTDEAARAIAEAIDRAVTDIERT